MFLAIEKALLVPRPDSRKAERCIRRYSRLDRTPVRYWFVDALLCCGWLGWLTAMVYHQQANLWAPSLIGFLVLLASWALWRLVIVRRAVRSFRERRLNQKIETLMWRGELLQLPHDVVDSWKRLREDSGLSVDSPSVLASIEVFYECFALIRGGLNSYLETGSEQVRSTLRRRIEQTMKLMAMYEMPTPELLTEVEYLSRSME